LLFRVVRGTVLLTTNGEISSHIVKRTVPLLRNGVELVVLENIVPDIVGYIIAVFVGLATGVVQFLLLYKFVTSVTGGKAGSKTLLFAVTQFLFPFVILVACAFLLPSGLMWLGIGAAASLVTCAVVKFVFLTKKKDVPVKSKGRKKK
jgi:accessory gene regulator protein AgrB